MRIADRLEHAATLGDDPGLRAASQHGDGTLSGDDDLRGVRKRPVVGDEADVAERRQAPVDVGRVQ